MKNIRKKRRTLFSLVLLLISIIGLSSCTQKPEDPDDNKGPIRTEFQLKSMSFNMKFENMSGGGDPIHTWAIRKNGIAEALKNYDVDIVGSQELQCWQHDELMGILGDAWASVGLPRFQKNSERCSILYNTKTIQYLEGETLWLSETPEVVGSKSWNSAQPRITTYGKFLHIPSQTEFYFFNTHLDHKSSEARKNQLALLVSYMQKYKEYPVILTGDFNMYLSDEGFSALTNCSDYDNTFSPFLQEFGNEMKTSHGFSGGTSGSPIDFLFYSLEKLLVESTTIIHDVYQGRYYLSDHYPVYSIFTLKENKNIS